MSQAIDRSLFQRCRPGRSPDSAGSKHHLIVDRHGTEQAGSFADHGYDYRTGKDPLGRGADLRLAPPVQMTPERYEIRGDVHLGLLQLACGIICLRRLRTSLRNDQ
ncbi:hypothetical protein JCM4814A_82620 [Streptomyces phaeofaciens JCM 4814]|uniref:Transposase n=1 Tax=Streptomyces phaeofaciens TaxID=68254 RepID=A0A918M0E2_9ACTN|nr:hypothetical protein GCM10010226_80620 [Streptomyces phaeofaciens]